MRGIRKAFGAVTAVDGVDLELRGGEIQALVGENGAGKSTLAAIAFGALRPDAGTVERRGTVGLVHQHFELIERMRVWENIVIGREPRRGVRIDTDAAKRAVRELAARNGLDVDPDAIVESLPVAMKQRVELLRELERRPAVLLLDEPTAALAPAEVAAFFATIVALARAGTAVLVVTHKLQEVLDYADTVSVMRRGKIVAHFASRGVALDEIARTMVGGELPKVAARASTAPVPRVRVAHLRAESGDNAVRDVSFEVRGGEIVAVAGVEGNGQTSLADALAGVLPYEGSIEGADARGVIPQDRLREGLVPSWSVTENVALGRQHARARRGALLDRRGVLQAARAIVERYDVRAPSVDARVATLSGGNQQKLVVGRALLDDPAFVVAYQPTRGIDVGAAALVQSRLMEARNAGAAVLLISFDLDEVFALADRILVLYRGRIAGTFAREDADRAKIGRLMAGGA